MNRTGFLAASASLVAAGAGVAADAQTVPGGTQFVERKSSFDVAAFDSVVGRPAQIRQLYEQVAFKPTVWNNVKNSFNGLQFGYGHAPDQIVVAFAGHGPSSAYGYSDYIWQKYRIGEFFEIKDDQGATVTANTWLKAKCAWNPGDDPDDANGCYQDTSIETLQKRGLVMLTCHTAVEEQSRAIVKKGFAPSGMTSKDVADDVLTHLIPGALVNPSMVATVAVLQKIHGYTYTVLA
jgi:hypothetical protein